jgi:hypothetical protein
MAAVIAFPETEGEPVRGLFNHGNTGVCAGLTSGWPFAGLPALSVRLGSAATAVGMEAVCEIKADAAVVRQSENPRSAVRANAAEPGNYNF